MRVNLKNQMRKGSYDASLLPTLAALEAEYQKKYDAALELYEKRRADIDKVNALQTKQYHMELDANTADLSKNEDVLQRMGLDVSKIKRNRSERVEKPISLEYPSKPELQQLTTEQQDQKWILKAYPEKVIVPEKIIEKICKNYNFVLGQACYYRGDIPTKLGENIRDSSLLPRIKEDTCWIAAPREMFDFSTLLKPYAVKPYADCLLKDESEQKEKKEWLKTKSDPMLFVEVAKGCFILIGEWEGKCEVSIFRRFKGLFHNYHYRKNYETFNRWLGHIINVFFAIGFLPVLLALIAIVFKVSTSNDWFCVALFFGFYLLTLSCCGLLCKETRPLVTQYVFSRHYRFFKEAYKTRYKGAYCEEIFQEYNKCYCKYRQYLGALRRNWKVSLNGVDIVKTLNKK